MTTKEQKVVNVTLTYAMGDDIDDELMKIIRDAHNKGIDFSIVNTAHIPMCAALIPDALLSIPLNMLNSIPLEIWYDLIKNTWKYFIGKIITKVYPDRHEMVKMSFGINCRTKDSFTYATFPLDDIGIEDKNKMIKDVFEYAEKHLDNKKCQYIHYEKTSSKWLDFNFKKKSE
mgnify:CR=1 FL=1